MEFLSVRELSKSPKVALDKLLTDGKAVITNNGKPQALMFKVDAANFEKTLSLVQQLEFTQAVANMQLESAQNGNVEMTLDEINAEIKAARR
ncbi:MAG: hypothetical protein LBQ88_04180, partial [Treponema sp.]|nr:hypothetical protein [Treponema sp.]